jgi:hypothetical protein
MLIRIRYTDTAIAVNEAIDKHNKDRESTKLFDLLILSFFCLESDYRYSQINRKIQNLLKLLDIKEEALEDIYNVLYAETKLYLPQYIAHSDQHCIPLSCIHKTDTTTFTFHLEGLPIIPVLS